MERRFAAGVLRLPAVASWERLARQLTLLNQEPALSLAVDRARRQHDGTYLLALYLTFDPLALDAGDPIAVLRSHVGRYVDAKIVGLGAIEPRRADADVLAHLMRAAAADEKDGRAIVAGDLEPATEAIDHELVGLERQQAVIDDVGLVLERFGRDALSSCHFAFMGGPGTGKTALARDLVRRFDALGVTCGEGILVKADLSRLIGRYVGHTAPQTRALVERAVGGVLYIDEAYGLMGNDFGRECVTTLVDQLDAHRHDVVCVIAGYRDGIERLLDSNEGLRERIPYRLAFPGYTDRELAQIFASFARSRRFELVDVDQALLASIMGRLRRQRGFAQARSVRNLFQDAVVAAAHRGAERTIRPEDLDRALARRLDGAAHSYPVGFSVAC